MRVSIKDIAKAAQVSHSTVSRALSGSPLVKPATKARIQRLAREMGYSPDAIARSLVVQKTHTVGVVVTTIADPFVAEIVQGIEDTAQENDYAVILASSASEPERELAAVDMLRAKRVDSVIVTSSRVGGSTWSTWSALTCRWCSSITTTSRVGRYTFSVSVDNQHGGHLATSHLIQRGHRRTDYVSGPANHSDDAERLDGYRQALDEAGIAFDQALVVQGNGRLDGGERALRTLVELDEAPTAVFCYNDMTAIGLLSEARQAGLSVPDDLAVDGVDNSQKAVTCPHRPQPRRRRSGSLFDCQVGTFSIVKVQSKELKWVICRLSNGYFFA
jgi:DNA-binding LacI/PurR family transcriptional regulator